MRSEEEIIYEINILTREIGEIQDKLLRLTIEDIKIYNFYDMSKKMKYKYEKILNLRWVLNNE